MLGKNVLLQVRELKQFVQQVNHWNDRANALCPRRQSKRYVQVSKNTQAVVISTFLAVLSHC